MATLNFPDDPSTGDVYKDGNSGFSYKWNGTVWISTDPSTASNIREIDDISGDFDGSDTTFTLKVAGVNVEPANVQQLIISVGGVMQNAGQDFTLSGSTLTFTTAPSSSLTFFGVLLGTALSLNTIANGSVGSASLKTEDFTIGGSGNTVTIPGNLTVQGTETIINTERLDIQDKTVGIASTNAPTSTSQDDAGIIIYGETDVNILYDRDKAALGINTSLHVSGVTTCGAGLSLVDNVKAKFGASGDLEIYHDGTDSFIHNNTGNFQVTCNEFRVKTKTGNESLIQGSDESDVQLYYDGVKRLETASNDEGGGIIVTGKIVGTAATIGSGVTINNTGIDAGIGAGIVTASSFVGGTGSFTGDVSIADKIVHTGDTNTAIRFPSNDTITFETNGDQALEITAGGGVKYNDSDSPGTANNSAQILNHSGGFQFYGSSDSGTNRNIIFGTNSVSAGEKLRITSTGSFQFSNGLFDENVKITAGKLSDNTNIDLENGMVHYFTTQESTTATPNIRINSSISLQTAMDTGNVCTVTLITTAAAAGYAANLTIDGNAVTEEWVGGSAPSAGSADGLDIYSYTIICIGTGTGDSGFKVIANLTNATN